MPKHRIIQEQENVMKVFDKNAIISASAGSGKTSVLIRKISDYITNHNIDLSNILALTYTKAAAGEIKERLSTALVQHIEEEILNEEEVDRLSGQIDKLSVSDISTFHSFYERLIKKYFYILGLNPSFEILSDEDLTVFKEDAFDGAIEKLKREDFDKYLDISDILGKKRKDNSIRDRVFKLKEFLSSQLDAENWLNKVSKTMFDDSKRIYEILRKDILEKVENGLKEINNLTERAKQNGEEKLVKHLTECCSILENFKNLSFKEMYEEINNKFAFPTLRMSKDIRDEGFFEEIKADKKDIKDFLDKWDSEDFGSWENIENSFTSCCENVQVIIDLYKNYVEILQKKKRDENKYEFGDLEDFCLSLLDNEKIREEIKQQYKLIFIDEFQDANPIQYELIKKISRGNNVFIVGDPKQSIYAFRQTDVDIFNSVYEEYLTSEAQALNLKSNFRSNKNILNFVNGVFDVLMTKDLSGIDYIKNSRFVSESENSCNREAVNISLIVKEEKQKEEVKEVKVYSIFDDIPEEEDVSEEAKLITQQISELIEEEIFDDKISANRKIDYRDITILMRKRKDLIVDLKKVFGQYKIPYLVNDNIDLLSSKEVSLVISLLKLCNNIEDDINLAVVLKSDFVQMSLDELAQIRMENRDEEYFYNCCLKYLDKHNDIISEKLKLFYKLINELRFNIGFKGIALAFDLAISKHKIKQKVSLKDNGEERAEIMAQFVSYIQKSGFDYNLLGLLDFIDNSEEICVSSIKKCDSNSVNITTIHGSKGLEYPVVFLCGAGKDLNNNKGDKADLKISKNYGMAIKNYDRKERKIYNSIFEEVIKIESRKKDLAENLRLLYVALTRAKNKLFISGEISLKNKITNIKNDYDLLNTKPQTFLNFILGTLGEKTLKTLSDDLSYSNDGLCVKIINEKVLINDSPDIKDKGLDLKLKKIKNYLDDIKIYPHKNAISLAEKTSVTNIMKENYGQENLTSEPKSFSTNEHLIFETSAEKGIIIHSILEEIDLKLEGESLKNNIIKNIEKIDHKFDKEFLVNLIINNVKTLKTLMPKNCRTYKEKQFILNASPKEIFGDGSEEKLLIQGKLDLICLGDENVIIDYKYTSIKDENKLVNKYKNQLLAYCFALEKAMSRKVDRLYLVNLTTGKATEIRNK